MQMRMSCNCCQTLLENVQHRGVRLRAVFRQARHSREDSSPVRPSQQLQGACMARGDRPRKTLGNTMRKASAANDNRPVSVPKSASTSPAVEDDCRDELAAMPDIGTLD